MVRAVRGLGGKTSKPLSENKSVPFFLILSRLDIPQDLMQSAAIDVEVFYSLNGEITKRWAYVETSLLFHPRNRSWAQHNRARYWCAS